MTTPRLTPLAPDALDERQRALYDAVLDSPRGQGPTRSLILREDETLTGPFDALLRSPVLGAHIERAGMALRTDTTVSDAARETAILVVASAWGAEFEWWVHGMVARGQGVPESTIEAIGRQRRPTEGAADVLAAHDVAFDLVHKRGLADDTHQRARAVLGEAALVDVVLAVGFYQLISGILESFHPAGPSGDFEVVGPPKPASSPAGIDLYQALSTTRAVRRLKADPIPDDVLRRVMRAATWAPSGANLQPWHVIAVRDPALKRRLQELNTDLWAAYAKPRRDLVDTLPDEPRERARRMLAAGDHLAEHLAETPVIAVFCFNPDVLHVTDADLGRTSVVGGSSIYPAVQNFLLACRAEGLGCVLTTLLVEREKEVRELLAIPEPWGTAAFVPIGWPERGGHGPIRRRPVEQTAFCDRFGQTLFDGDDDGTSAGRVPSEEAR